MDGEPLTLTVGHTQDGERLAVISMGGHPQKPGSGECAPWLSRDAA